MEIKSSSESVGAAGSSSKRGMVLPFQPLSLAFNHVNYYVDMPAVSHSFRNVSFSDVCIQPFGSEEFLCFIRKRISQLLPSMLSIVVSII